MAGGLIAAVPFSLRSYTRLEIAAHITGRKQARPMRVPPAAPPVGNRPRPPQLISLPLLAPLRNGIMLSPAEKAFDAQQSSCVSRSNARTALKRFGLDHAG
jgi:hypothetical protein